MKRVLIIFILLLLAFTNARAGQLRGVWTARVGPPGQIEISMSRLHHQHSESMHLSSFRGLAAAQTNAAAETGVQFRLEREAGLIQFDGTFQKGDGSGRFLFTPAQAFRASLHALGFSDSTSSIDGESDEEMIFEMALLDVSSGFIRSMQALGYHEPLKRYVEMRIFRVTPELVQDFQSLGYRDIPAQRLVETQIHGADPEFIRSLAAAGVHQLSIKELIDFRIFRITPDLIGQYRSLGYEHLEPQQLVTMSIHRVTPDFIRELKEAGYVKVPVDKLIAMRIQGVDGTFARKIQHAR